MSMITQQQEMEQAAYQMSMQPQWAYEDRLYRHVSTCPFSPDDCAVCYNHCIHTGYAANQDVLDFHAEAEAQEDNAQASADALTVAVEDEREAILSDIASIEAFVGSYPLTGDSDPVEAALAALDALRARLAKLPLDPTDPRQAGLPITPDQAAA